MKKLLSSRLLVFTLKENCLPFAILSVATVILTSLANSITLGYSLDTVSILNIASISPLLKIVPLIMIPFTVRAFGFYMKRCEADFYESLPYTRTQALFSVTAALSVLSFAALAVISFGSLLISVEHLRDNVFLVGDSLLLLLAYIIACETAIFGTAIAVSVTGHTVNAMLASALLLYTPRWMIDAVAGIAEESPLLFENIEIFKNQYNLLTSQPVDIPRASAYIYSLILTVLMAFCALVLFRRRKSEIATNFYGARLVGHIIRVAISLPAAFLLIGQFSRIGNERFGTVAVAIFFSLLLLAVIYFGYELIAVRGKRAFAIALRGLPILVGASAVVVAAGFSVGAAASARLPEAASISYVRINHASNPYGDLSMQQYVMERLYDLRLEDEESRRIVADALRENTEAYKSGEFEKKYYYSDVQYADVNVEIGTAYGSFKRTLMIKYDDYNKLNETLAEREEYRRMWMELPDTPYAVIHNPDAYAQLSRADAGLAYEAILRDVSNMSFEEWYAANAYGAHNSITVVFFENGNAYKLRLPISAETPEVNEFVIKRMNEITAEGHRNLVKLIDAAVSGGKPLEISVNLWTGETNQFSWFVVDDGEQGRQIGEFVKGLTLPSIPDENGWVDVGIWIADRDEYKYYEFALSDKYTVDEIKQYFNQEMAK